MPIDSQSFMDSTDIGWDRPAALPAAGDPDSPIPERLS